MHMSLNQFKREVTWWRHKWLSVEEDIPQILVETLDSANPEFYPGIFVGMKTLLTYPASTCAAERVFSSMKRLRRHLGALCRMRDCPQSLSMIYVHNHKEIDFDKVISDFAGKKDKNSSVFVKENHYNFYES